MPTTRQFFKLDRSTPLPKRHKTLSAPRLLGIVREALAQIDGSILGENKAMEGIRAGMAASIGT